MPFLHVSAHFIKFEFSPQTEGIEQKPTFFSTNGTDSVQMLLLFFIIKKRDAKVY